MSYEDMKETITSIALYIDSNFTFCTTMSVWTVKYND